MKRDHYDTVSLESGFAILVQVYSPEEATGEATFLSESFSPYVRAVTLLEMKRAARGLKGQEADEFSALLALKGALESQDPLAMENAMARLGRVYEERRKEYYALDWDDEASRREFARLMEPITGVPGLSAEESLEHFRGLRPGPRALKDARRLFSYEVTRVLRRKRIEPVLWCVKTTPGPAFFCWDLKTAVFAYTFLIAPPDAKWWRVCPNCGDLFWQAKPHQTYCKVAHREAHRLKRWRNRNKEKLQIQKGK
jgi:hypothetical protein